ncbi:response regulator [Spongiimicrobium salis]|uniref:response regulator n=1 Tax=Spongiimicrobium salis TaxID=1667022 RepID=UPI00374DFBDC
MKNLESTCIIDDDELFVFGVKLLMRKMKAFGSLRVYANGQEALKSLREMLEKGEKLPDLFFLDLNMPIMDGWEFLESFKKIPQEDRNHITLFVVSSSVDPEDLQKTKQYELIKNYILKPITVHDLEEVLSQVA